ncbi:MAG: site-specific DNA-methyltransferase [Actinomycetota bacterium]
MAIAEDLQVVHHGDARRLGEFLDRVFGPKNPQPLTCTITSPPYWDMKDYGTADQIGFGQPYDEYLVEMRRLFRTLHQRTADNGSLWLIADTLRTSSGELTANLPAVQPLPFDLVREAADAGWVLRETIVWVKDKTLPWSSGKRLRNGFEYVLLLVKSENYHFHTDRLRDPENLSEWWVKWPERYNPNGKAPTNVWEIPIPVQGSWKTPAVVHACPLPPQLVERLVLLSTDPGDVVLDPFAGTGAVVAESRALGREGLGLDINSTFVKAFRKSVLPAVIEAEKAKDEDISVDLRTRIIKLRAMKYPKVLAQRLLKVMPDLDVRLIHTEAGRITKNTMTAPESALPLSINVVVGNDVPESDRVEAERVLKDASSRAPATKFGITPDIHVRRIDDLALLTTRKRFALYDEGKVWDYSRRIQLHDLHTLTPPTVVRKGAYAYPPIVSSVEVRETPGARS